MNLQARVSESLVKVNKKNKKEEILEVASLYFLAHGYSGTSITEMAREARISKESIYRYFGSKENLFFAVIDKELWEYQEKLSPKVSDFSNLRETLILIGGAISAALNSDKTLALRRLIFQQATLSADIGQHYFSVGPKRADELLSRLFKFHQDETRFSPENLVQYFVAIVGHRLVLERECRVQDVLTEHEAQSRIVKIVDDFIGAFFST